MYILSFHKKISIESTMIILINILLLLALTRGVFQLVLPKPLTMAIQLLGVVSIAYYSLKKIPFEHHLSAKIPLYNMLFFCGIVLASALLTILMTNSIKWFFYFAYTLLFLIQLLFFMNLALKKVQLPGIFNHLIAWAAFLVFVAILEHLKIIKMPGKSSLAFLVRPASTTGSMLHYPIIMALFSGIFFSHFKDNRKIYFLVAGLISSLVPFVVFSRSGIFILACFVFFAYLQLFSLNRPLFTKITAIFFAITFIILSVVGTLSFLSKDQHSYSGMVIHRVFSSFEKRSKGNNTRMQIWHDVAEKWQQTNLLIGEKMGEYTNSTSFLNEHGRGKVTESSILQQLMNFGFLGTLSFYLLLILPLFIIDPQGFMYRGLYLAGLLQTLFVQSIEVVSYMSVLLLIPCLSFQRLKRSA